MTPNVRVRLSCCWPPGIGARFRENLYLGVWSPETPLAIEADLPDWIDRVEGETWWLCGTRSPVHGDGRSLIFGHPEPGDRSDCGDIVAFRGYVLDPPLHSYSSGVDVLEYWSGEGRESHNGVFSSAVVSRRNNTLTLTADALGMEPLYYRVLGEGTVLFSTNPRYLRFAGDHPDRIAWGTRLECGFISSDRSLTEEIARVPAGASLRFSAQGMRTDYWHAPAEFPSGTRPVSERSLDEVEDCFRACVRKVLRLDNGQVTLPLSSGHDSRRILSALLADEVGFDALTVRVRQKEHRDLDATYAAAMARDLGFNHRVIEFADPEQYARDAMDRGLMTDFETSVHSWVIRFMESLPDAPALLIDGLLGDILGNPGFRMSGMYRSTEDDLGLILREVFNRAYLRYLDRRIWPKNDVLEQDVIGYLAPFMRKRNMAEFAFILLRQRRMTALWSHQLLPAGYIAACPYLDLEYLELLFSYQPEGKHATIFQRACLERFWPDLARYPGNRDIPADQAPGSATWADRHELAHFRNLCRALSQLDGERTLLEQLSSPGRQVYRLARRSDRAAIRWGWLLSSVAEMSIRECQPPVWEGGIAP